MGFKKDFVWGAATASYQIEGAYKEDGKGLNVWDIFTHQKGKTLYGATGDIACDHYHRYKEDVKLMSELGLKAYRFSISWSRIMPDGTGKVNPKGIAFYNNLINELLKYSITPYITLYHWDLPYELYLRGGWLNKESSQWFEEYTKVVAENFGDRVKDFITFNEPSVFVGLGLMQGSHAPGLNLGYMDSLRAGHNILLAHGKAVKVLRQMVENCNVGITLATGPSIPVSKKDEKAAYNSYFHDGLEGYVWTINYWLDPIVFGKYGEGLKKEAGEFFPHVTRDEMLIINQKIDFLGLNIYQANYVGDYHRPDGTAHTELSWDVFPDALKWGAKLNYQRYKLPIYITENGLSCHDWISLDGKVHDPNRIDFLHRYIKGLRDAADDGVDIRGYFQWSFMDNFEWAYGFNPRFGMIFCDYATQKRIPKDSAYWYKSVIENNADNL